MGAETANLALELSEEDELRFREEKFARLEPETLFNLAGMRYFIAVRKISKSSWWVIELTKKNKQRIISGEPCEYLVLCFDEMACLNICDVVRLSFRSATQ